MKICVFGSKNSTIKLLKFFSKNQIKVDTLVLIDPSKFSSIEISGHKKSILSIAKNLGISCYFVKTFSLKSQADKNFFKEKLFDLGFCTSWQRIIPANILNLFTFGVYGWHGSGYEFPNGRGRSPINWSIRLGLNSIFHNCFKYSAGVDDGDIYETRNIEINENEYIDDIQEKATMHICDSALRLINDINLNKLKLTKQLNYPFISFPSLNEESGRLYPDLLNVESARNIVRSCSHPFPGAYIVLSDFDIKIRIWKAEIISNEYNNIEVNKGYLIYIDKNIFVSFFDGLLKLTNYEIEKKSFILPQKKKLKCN